MNTFTVWFAIVLIAAIAIIQEKRHRDAIREDIKRRIRQ